MGPSTRSTPGVGCQQAAVVASGCGRWAVDDRSSASPPAAGGLARRVTSGSRRTWAGTAPWARVEGSRRRRRRGEISRGCSRRESVRGGHPHSRELLKGCRPAHSGVPSARVRITHSTCVLALLGPAASGLWRDHHRLALCWQCPPIAVAFPPCWRRTGRGRKRRSKHGVCSGADQAPWSSACTRANHRVVEPRQPRPDRAES